MLPDPGSSICTASKLLNVPIVCKFERITIMTENQQRPDPSRICRLEPQEMAVTDFPASGFILDIGGGGEGIIGQLKGDQVVAIDRIKHELEEAPAGPLKIVMNAGDMQFLDASFATATAFFSLMFMPAAEHGTVFGEVFRVLAPGGRFLIWDITAAAAGRSA